MLHGPWPRVTAEGVRVADLEAGVAADAMPGGRRLAIRARRHRPGPGSPPPSIASSPRRSAPRSRPGWGSSPTGPSAGPTRRGAARGRDHRGRPRPGRAARPRLAVDRRAHRRARGPGRARPVEPRDPGRRRVGRSDRRSRARGRARRRRSPASSPPCRRRVPRRPGRGAGRLRRRRRSPDAGRLPARPAAPPARRPGPARDARGRRAGPPRRSAPEAIFGAPYRSYLFDLIEGADNWRLVRCRATRAGDRVRRARGGRRRRGARPGAAARLGGPIRRFGRWSRAGPDRPRQRDVACVRLRPPPRAARSRPWHAPPTMAGLPLPEAIKAGLDPRTVRTLPPPGGPDAVPAPRAAPPAGGAPASGAHDDA